MMKVSCVLVLGFSFLRAVRGNVVVEHKNNCDTITNGTCCVGGEACAFLAVSGPVGSLSVDTDSCNGVGACRGTANFGGSAEIGSNSCLRNEACEQSGQNGGFFRVGDNACSCDVGHAGDCQSCQWVAQFGHGTIGDGSCFGSRRACRWAGNTGYFKVGRNSCQLDESCLKAGYFGSSTIGSNSCVGPFACFSVGRGIPVIIGTNSCNGEGACQTPLEGEPIQFTVGDLSCNGDGVCACFTGGENVPHNSCNKFGADECCEDASTKGNKDLTQSIQLTYDHWDITTVNTSIVEDGPRIKLEFNTSNRDYSTQVLEDDCETNLTGVSKSSISFIDTPLTSSGQFVQYDTLIKINHTALENDGTYWNSISDTLGFVKFCVLTELYLHGTEETVNFLSNVVNITINTDGNFEVFDIDVNRTGPEESEVAVDYSTYLEAYQCTPDNLTQENTKVYSQGSVLVVCVKGDGDVVEVENIKQLSVNQGSTPSFEYISETNGYNAAIVTTECEDDNSNRICSAQLRLLGRFFASDDPENLQVTGSVTMTFPSNRARRLSQSAVPRFLQDVSDTGAFNIDAELEKIEDSVNSQSILSGNVKYYLSSVALYYVVGLVWYIV